MDGISFTLCLHPSACIPLARFVPSSRGWVGRPSKDRLAIASAFVAKAVYGFSLTRQLLDALASDTQLRRICGWPVKFPMNPRFPER